MRELDSPYPIDPLTSIGIMAMTMSQNLHLGRLRIIKPLHIASTFHLESLLQGIIKESRIMLATPSFTQLTPEIQHFSVETDSVSGVVYLG